MTNKVRKSSFRSPLALQAGGLIWFATGERVRILGPEHAVLGNGTRVYERITANGPMTSVTPR